ncbi:MAG: glycosyltransferase family 4 protein [Gemmatimonadales bacterium]
MAVNVRNLTGPHTGIEVYMLALLRALAETGRLDITALSWSPVGLDLPRVREVVPARRPDIAPGSARATLWKLWFDHWGAVRGLPSESVVYHGMDGFLPLGIRRRDRCVATVHDLGWQVHPELYDRRLRLMYGVQFPWVVRRANRFVAVSRYTADDLMRRAGVPSSRIDVVYHGLDPAFAAARIETPAAYEPYLLAVGGVSPRKNTRRLLDAFARWRERGGDGRRHRLLVTGLSLDRDFVERRAVPEGVTLLGYVEKDALPGLYANAAAFVYPGIYEGFGLPIVEAMACGAPVVTSTTGAAPEIAGGAAVLVDPFDVDSIVDGLEQATRPDEAARLRGLGRARARTFRWEDAAQATIEAYRRAAA